MKNDLYCDVEFGNSLNGCRGILYSAIGGFVFGCVVLAVLLVVFS